MNKIIFTPENPEGVIVEMTAEEIADREAVTSEVQAKIDAEEAAATQKATDQASGNQKLLDLGLTQEEATALTGYVPPSE